MLHDRRLPLLVVLALLLGIAGFVLLRGGSSQAARTISIGQERIVSWEPLPEMNGEMCQWMPASASPASPAFMTLAAAMQQASGQARTSAPPHPSAQAREAVASRNPIYTVSDSYYGFAGIAVDPVRDEVIIAEENVSNLVIYDRLTNTPPTASLSEPKRVIGGDEAFLEYACSVYVDPATGDIFGVNNDTMNWMPVFGRDARGNVAPDRKLRTPHTTFGIVADEEQQELLLTIQDDHAVIVFKKDAKDEDSPVRILQGEATLMADPHGIALDTKRNEIFVANWGTNNQRPPLSEGGGGDARHEREDFPVGRNRAFSGSGRIAPPSITVYPKNAQGDTAPLRVISGPKTQMDWPTSLAVHPERGEIYVANDTGNSVIVFPVTAEGDVAPIRVIKGPRTMVKNPTGIALDLENNELWVANFGSHAATVFPVDANGDVAPKRVIRSAPVETPSPMLSNAHTVDLDTKRDELLVAN
jgi:DNA-binding beta-propeller fold protein YncE